MMLNVTHPVEKKFRTAVRIPVPIPINKIQPEERVVYDIPKPDNALLDPCRLFLTLLQRSSGQARVASSSISIAAPNCCQRSVFQKSSISDHPCIASKYISVRNQSVRRMRRNHVKEFDKSD